jgi:hypothetical protein
MEALRKITTTFRILPVRERKEEEKEGESEEEKTLDEIPSGVQAQHGNYVVEIVETHKVEFPFRTEYIVTVRLKDGDRWLGPFQVYASNAEDFKRKLAEDIARYERLKGVRERWSGT